MNKKTYVENVKEIIHYKSFY